jgi:hypothetical protein
VKVVTALPAVLAAALSLGAGACKRSQDRPSGGGSPGPAPPSASAAPVPPGPLLVSKTTIPIKTDGELDEPVWNAAAARSKPFVDASGGEARPYSDARFLWDDHNLYVGLYAADDDIQTTVTAHDGPVWTDDAFSLHLTPADAGPGSPTYGIDVSAAGVVTDVKRTGSKDDPSWESGIKLGIDKDGTINDPHDDDEEWVVEASIPFAALGVTPRPGTRILVDISRCDTPKRSHERRCGSFGSPGAPRVLELAP